MSGTGKRGADKLNIVGVVTVGVCGAVLTYVSVVLLEAFYMGETSQVEEQRAFEAPQSLRNTVKAAGLTSLDGTREGTIAIDQAMALIVEEAPRDPANLVPAIGRADQPTVVAEYGRPPTLPATPAAPAPADGASPDPATPAPTDPAAPSPDAPATAPGTAPAPAGTTPADGTTPAPAAPATPTPAPGGDAP